VRGLLLRRVEPPVQAPFEQRSRGVLR
jgi:hypothetical protein